MVSGYVEVLLLLLFRVVVIGIFPGVGLESCMC